MTNGEKIKEIFPNIIKYGNILIDDTGALQKNILFDDTWWNAEYKEPTTQERQAESDKFDAAYQDGYNCGYAQARFDYEQDPTSKNDIAQERYQDLIDYFGDKEVAKTILEDRKEFKAWLERLRWNVKRADELARELKQLKETTKNDLEVDCISREDALMCLTGKFENRTYEPSELISMFSKRIKALPSITPQGLVIRDKGVKDELNRVKDELKPTIENDLGVDCISRQAVIDGIKEYFHDEYYQRTSIQDCRDCFIEDVLNNLPSVIPQEPRVDFEELKRKILMEVDGGTDDAWLAYGEVCDRITNTIDEFVSDMRGEEV